MPLPAAGVAGGPSLGDLYSKCVQMVNENKISTKNAWELPLIDHMDSIVDSFMGGRKAQAAAKANKAAAERRASRASTGSQPSKEEEEENRFHEASCTIEASARIYACRVDCVHTDTYRVLGGLNSADLGDEEEGAEGGADGGAAKKKRRIVGVNTLEKNEANIVQSALDIDEQSDPTFRRMAAAFDAGGAKGLLLGHLPLAEDLSLVFNGDVPLNRAAEDSKQIFKDAQSFSSECMGLGKPQEACKKLSEARVCSQIDRFRQQLVGGAAPPLKALPDRVEAIFGAMEAAKGRLPLPGPGPNEGFGQIPLEDAPAAGGFDADLGMPDDIPSPTQGPTSFAPPGGFEDTANSSFGTDGAGGGLAAASQGAGNMGTLGGAGSANVAQAGSLSLPVAEGNHALVAFQPGFQGDEDVIIFDQLFQKFCNTASGKQFAYFDECWGKGSKRNKEGDKKGAAASEKGGGGGGGGGGSSGSKDDLEMKEEGVLVPTDIGKERGQKRPLFDLTAENPPVVKPIATEAAQKHQLSERAAQWQLHKDVPPYMIDRITMPSWPTWSKCDFASLGLRPHLMLKLVRKAPPQTPGPHSFTDLFSTVLVENAEAYPWLAAEARAAAAAWRRDDEDGPNGQKGNAEEEDDDIAVNGLPSHLDINPQDLFLRPGEQVLAGAAGAMARERREDDDEDFAGGGDFDNFGDMEMEAPGDGIAPFEPDLDMDLVDKPATVGDTEIAYSRNSKFVDVKLVKKHLLDCINEDLEGAKELQKPETDSSFQGLVDRTVRRMPRHEKSNLSVAVCFICALHLCNEKNLELKVDEDRPLGDFTVVGSSTSISA
mmetsp:Transcript_2606/g.6248  ORF Transcript_2606/g.6248 Transcript_2606/m.6248 type:complete len:826 (-) Transcript_2606:258-2735(-)